MKTYCPYLKWSQNLKNTNNKLLQRTNTDCVLVGKKYKITEEIKRK